ncbi:hypothetical protein [Lysinibacillus piscis]|uniref:Uncharacterized protein n=1 Tax=Lysinibacillus piscis TaxID=2518931 RepID=A0ABQ5NMP7_9BACI|nr:hypothetical protein [Lysinibacillus sp. KH24]GLC89376.1 hypothetical protein LYSBPC_25030 [Lysinibacillus sp. KH24]
MYWLNLHIRDVGATTRCYESLDVININALVLGIAKKHGVSGEMYVTFAVRHRGRFIAGHRYGVNVSADYGESQAVS